MKTRSGKLNLSVSTIAVIAALAELGAMPAYAEDDEIKLLTTPTSFVEMGVSNTSDSSAKFGEYKGLNKQGADFIGNLDVRGGNAHDGSGGTMQWEITGRDLGLTSREFGASIGNQGQWNLGIGYDELRHNITDSYQTPLQGSMGSNNFTLPANFGTINGQSNPSTRVLNAIQLGTFHSEDVSTTRKNTSFTAGYFFNPQLNMKFDFNHLDQSGAKLIGMGAQGGQATPYGGAANTWRAEAVSILMNPTNYQTDTFNLALNWVGDKGHLTMGYYGSLFRDGYNSLSWQNNLSSNATGTCASGGNCTYQTNVASTAPNNNFHQLNLTGGYAFTPITKLSGGLSYGRNSQDDGYSSAVMQAGGLPQASLDGSVITTHADLKLTNQTTKDLAVSAGFKFNERNNRTSSNTYNYVDIGGANETGVNVPYSNRKTQYELAADYRLTKAQNLRLALEREDIKRWCENNAAGTECLASPSSSEDRLGLTYRLNASEKVKLNAGYTYAKRDSSFDHDYVSPIGVNGSDVVGFVAYPYASRTQDIFKAGVNWQVTDRFDLGLTGRYSKDKYDATLGVQDGNTASINLDATFNYSENGSVSAYASWQNASRNLQNAGDGSATVAPTQIWTNKLRQTDTSFGLTAKHGGLMGGKLELMGDLSYSFGTSGYSTKVPYLATCGAAGTLTCGSTPDIENTYTSLKLTGTYAIDKKSKLALIYLYQKLNSNDYYYNGYQYGYTPNRVMPSNEQPGSYSENVVAVTYLYTF